MNLQKAVRSIIHGNDFLKAAASKDVLKCFLSTNQQYSSAQKVESTEDENTDYENIEIFRKKSNKELLRSFLTLKLSSIDTFVKYSEKLFLIGNRLLWKPIFQTVMAATFYGQFAAGVTVADAEEKVVKLKELGIRSMLCVPIESTTHESDADAEKTWQKNKKIVEDCIKGTAHVDPNGFSQVKITALCDKQLLLQMNTYLLEHETDHQESGAWDIKTMASLLEWKGIDQIRLPQLSHDMNEKLKNLFLILDDLAQLCVVEKIRMTIDAEQTYIQATLGYIILVLQAKYNKKTTMVYNTYQCYRKDTLDRVKADHNLARQYGFHIAAKLVRGAYMAEERRLAKENNYKDPINDTYCETNQMYHSVVDYLLPFVITEDVGVMIASHNENTVDYVKKRMVDLNIDKNTNALCFGQIYGMCDHVSYYLGREGYQTFKSLPYGNMEDTLLYLARRAHENKSVAGRTVLERLLIRKELKRRLFWR